MITLGGMRELEVIAHVGSVYRPAQGYNPESDRSSAVELGGQSFVPVELAVELAVGGGILSKSWGDEGL